VTTPLQTPTTTWNAIDNNFIPRAGRRPRTRCGGRIQSRRLSTAHPRAGHVCADGGRIGRPWYCPQEAHGLAPASTHRKPLGYERLFCSLLPLQGERKSRARRPPAPAHVPDRQVDGTIGRPLARESPARTQECARRGCHPVTPKPSNLVSGAAERGMFLQRSSITSSNIHGSLLRLSLLSRHWLPVHGLHALAVVPYTQA